MPHQSADGSMATMARKTVGGIESNGKSTGYQSCGDGALRAHEALPQTPPGGKPPETAPGSAALHRLPLVGPVELVYCEGKKNLDYCLTETGLLMESGWINGTNPVANTQSRLGELERCELSGPK